MKILIADDSYFIRNVLTKATKDLFKDAEIFSSIDGQDAYNQFIQYKPDILITDILMPVMTGQQLICKLKKDGFKPNIIVISADIQNKTKEELDAEGILAFINKPLTSDKLGFLTEIIRGLEHA